MAKHHQITQERKSVSIVTLGIVWQLLDGVWRRVHE